MALIGMRDVCWGFGEPLLLENVTFQIEKGSVFAWWVATVWASPPC